MRKIFFYISIVFVTLIPKELFSQTNNETEQNFLIMRNYIVAIGTVVDDMINIDFEKKPIKKFVAFGTGLMTYVRIDSAILHNVVTAGHVVKFFREKNLKNIYIRPSWADTIKTTDYWGIEIPLVNIDSTPNTFLYPDKEVDLGSIVMPSRYFNKTFIDNANKDSIKIFPINSMTIPYIGNQIWTFGYPDHVETDFQNNFLYNISTFKPGYIVWKPSLNMTNKDLYHITLMESNATHGNSGSPVFALTDKIELIGILSGGYYESNSVYIDDQLFFDPISKKALIAKSRAGVCIIEKAEYVKKLVQYVHSEIDLYNKGKHK